MPGQCVAALQRAQGCAACQTEGGAGDAAECRGGGAVLAGECLCSIGAASLLGGGGGGGEWRVGGWKRGCPSHLPGLCGSFHSHTYTHPPHFNAHTRAQDLSLSFELTASDVLEPQGQQDLMLLALYLFQTLPQLTPSSTVEFLCKLGESQVPTGAWLVGGIGLGADGRGVFRVCDACCACCVSTFRATQLYSTPICPLPMTSSTLHHNHKPTQPHS